MNLHRCQKAWMCWGTVIALTGSAWAQATTTRPVAATQPAANREHNIPQLGYVTGNDVYVRSGFNPNYYPVTKLNRGEQVTIISEKFGWLEVLPLVGTHSLVDKTYVDRIDDKTGVINGRVWTYAGSNIDNRRYAKQVKLDKGARVQITGETEDGDFFKIVPPQGAHLWISGDFVSREKVLTRVDEPKAPAIEPIKPAELKLDEEKPERSESTFSPLPKIAPKPAALVREIEQDKFQTQINAIEAEIAAESVKPAGDRVFGPILKKLQPLAEQTEDRLTKIYADTRIKQLRDHIELIDAVKEIRQIREQAVSAADKIARERAKIKAAAAKPIDDIVVRGEIRVSRIYDGSGQRPMRWRMVEPGTNKTLAFIEVPKGSPIDPVQYYGKYIGIRASARHLLGDTIPPMPVYTVEQIVVLDPAAQKEASAATTLIASPKPTEVSPPSSQPAAEPADSTQPGEAEK